MLKIYKLNNKTLFSNVEKERDRPTKYGPVDGRALSVSYKTSLGESLFLA